jgi:hypothetical protein
MWRMRWQRLSVFETLASGSWALAVRRLAPSIALACLTVGSALVLAPALLPAEAEELIEEGDVDDAGPVGDSGMPDTNPRVKSILAAHPGEFVTICVAGCRDKPSIVQILPMPATERAGEMRTTAGSMNGSRKGRPANATGFAATDPNAVTCVAGCGGRPGQVLQRMPDLPVQRPPSPRKEAEAGNEPLDIGR